MDPFLILTMIASFALAMWYCGTFPASETTKSNKPKPGVSDEEIHKEFMSIYGSDFKAKLNKLGIKGGLGIKNKKK